MEYIDISPDEFILSTLDEQMNIMKNLIKDFAKEEIIILKNMIDNERKIKIRIKCFNMHCKF